MGSLTTVNDWLHHCIRCGNCKYVFKDYIPSCPSGEHFKFETYFASGRLRIAQGIHKGELEWDKDLLDPLFACTTCGSCEVQCLAPHREHIVDVIEEIRAHAVDALGPLERHENFKSNIEQNHNPYGEEHHAREMKDIHNLPDTAEYVYFIGCTANYRETQIRDATISLLKKAGLDFTIVNEYCCSSPLLRTGQRSLPPDIAAHNINEIENAGAKRVVTSCSGCFRTMKRDYLNLGLDYQFEVLHTTELLEELLDSNQLTVKKSEDSVYTWHDPCHLGRHMNVYDTPRNVMEKAGIKYLEMVQNRENAWCCGAGGGARAAYSDWSLLTAKTRIEQAKGNTRLVTACPFCVKNLQDAADPEYEVLDLVEIIDRIT
ncbi:MAG: (Fe-S)-binding protein [Candidatus Thorarchaeota archaeon]